MTLLACADSIGSGSLKAAAYSMGEDSDSSAAGAPADMIVTAKPAPLFRQDTTTVGKPGFFSDELGNLKVVNWATRCPCCTLVIGQYWRETGCIIPNRAARASKNLTKHLHGETEAGTETDRLSAGGRGAR